jgi:hypothetical protein
MLADLNPRPDLADEEVDASWEFESRARGWSEHHATLTERLAAKHAADRSLKYATNYVFTEPPPGQDIPERILPDLERFMHDW